MTHYAVTVKVTKERLDRHEGNLDKTLEEMFAPYNEGTEDKQYLAFHDETEDSLKTYETDTREYVVSEKGHLIPPWDECWRDKTQGLFGRVEPPKHLERVHIPFKVLYPTFEVFAKEWSGYKMTPEGRVGYWRNPNSKWDWYQIGGRWMGFYPLKKAARARLGRAGAFDNPAKPGHGDIVQLADIDFEAVNRLTLEKAERFWAEYTDWLAEPKAGTFNDARSWAMNVGLIDVVQGPTEEKILSRYDVLDNEEAIEKRVIPWAAFITDPNDTRKTWNDVCLVPTKAAFIKNFLHRFNVITTFAVLDDDGWHAPGDMGWWGADHSEEKDKDAYKRTFMERYLLSASPTDTIVVVDCHI
jgi:hypothetical protein